MMFTQKTVKEMIEPNTDSSHLHFSVASGTRDLVMNNFNKANEMANQSPQKGLTARERAIHAVEYYNNNVLRARMGAGLAGPRNSVHERHHFGGRPLNAVGNKLYPPYKDNLYRSNSSLELLHDPNLLPNDNLNSNNLGGNLRREYGSHGSIDVISSDRVQQTTGESFLAMLQEYRPAVLGLNEGDRKNRMVAKAGVKNSENKMTNYQHNKPPAVVENVENHRISVNAEDLVDRGNASPKLRLKLNRLWVPGKQTRSQSHVPGLEDSSQSSLNSSIISITASSADIEERQRRRAFAHFDCQSLTANLGYAAKLREILLARRRNTTTGASAAAMYSTRSSTPDADSNEEDFGDGQHNELLDNCPFFRSEVGGEEEREVSLTRMLPTLAPGVQRRAIHRPALAYGVSILECSPSESLWKQTTCPFQRGNRPIEQVDNGAYYYRNYFLGQEHSNWFGMDEHLGPVAISIKKEKPTAQPPALHPDQPPNQQHLFRLIVRTSELLTLRGSVFEDSIPNPRGPGKSITTKDVLEYVAPEVQIPCLRLGVQTPQCEQQLLKLDEQGLTNKYKIGILYCKAGQATEEDMYNNEDAGPAFVEFLETIGSRVRLKGFENYKAGLDNKTDSTGTHSVYATYQNYEIMFHVSTMLPFTPNNRQQLLRKRHIGNDIVTIVFQEPGALPFTPKNIRSQFQHVFVIVQAVNPCTENTHYRVAVSRSKEVPIFGPPINPNAIYPKGKQFADFLLAKLINAENAAHRSEKFSTMATRTRQEYLKDLCTNYITQTPVETGQKFSIFPSKKKEPTKPRFSGDVSQAGAFCWQVVLHDGAMSTNVDCFLGISAETFVLIEECSRQIIFVTPCKSILGWSTNGNSLRVYHHQGECVTMNMRDTGDRDEQLEVIERLRSVTNGCGALELSLRRNPMGQLGFHVQPDGVVTQVEMSGQAWAAGLRQGYRLVEICKVAVATLSHDQMVDLLKTSAQVTVTVIESFPDFSPRRGCLLQSCKFNALNYENDYETVHPKQPKNEASKAPQHQTHSNNHRRRYDRNFSPPRSSSSSGYGTGNSSRSFTVAPDQRFVPDMGTLTSSSSGHSSNDDRWYDVLEHHEHPIKEEAGPQQSTTNYHPKLIQKNSLPIGTSNQNRSMPFQDSRPLPRQANIELLRNHNSKIPDYVSPESLMKNLHIEEKRNEIVNQPAEPIYSVSMKSVNMQKQREQQAKQQELLNEENFNRINMTNEASQMKRSATVNNIYGKKTPTGSTNSTASSRNNSPRPLVEAKLRTNRPVNGSQRNSVNYTSTLQEDLLKLISPDYISVGTSSDDNFHQGQLLQFKDQKGTTQNSHSLGNLTQSSPLKASVIADDLLLMKKRSRSREGINMSEVGGKNSLQLIKSPHEEDIVLTKAHPATVITSNSPSPASELLSNHKILQVYEEKSKSSLNSSPIKTNGIGGEIPSGLMKNKLVLPPDMNDMDWNSLMDSAKKAMLQINEHSGNNGATLPEPFYEELNGELSAINSNKLSHQSENTTPNSLSPISSQNSVGECSNSSTYGVSTINGNLGLPELQNQVTQLSDRVMRETRRRRSLELAVRRLTEENRRLQTESQQAVQQLKRFTEWLYQTIDRQS